MVSRMASYALVLATAFSIVGSVSAQSRQYAPGVLTIVPPDRQYEETFSGPMEVVEISKGLP